MKEQIEKQETVERSAVLDIAMKIVAKQFFEYVEKLVKLNKLLDVENQNQHEDPNRAAARTAERSGE